MSHLLFQDGQFFRDDKLLVGANNRGLRYGDGAFETMKVNAGQVQLGDWHMERLFAALKLLQFDCPSYFSPSYLLDMVKQLVHRNGHSKLARVRLMVHRGNGGLYDPENHYPHHIIQSWNLPETNHQWNENGLVVGIHKGARKAPDVLANHKTNNYLAYILGALEAKKEKWNDAIILNTEDRICDATIANIFLVENGRIITPSLEEGPVAGIMRRFLVTRLSEQRIDIAEEPVSVERIMAADEVFLSNSIYGMKWVNMIAGVKYKAEKTRAIYEDIIRPLFMSR
ncbi:aminotransferase class IV [Flavihumibacter stibioxidans]|uniref:branched-chain-amino-acid transaminase n=1 Tax=Flavihumibacter stibioxidans TaxID=1834163 RepID=A0ABR7MBY4_9BACT|nr:aminotransferase class IV [Flavihumibacter stibioxidans]MBC6492541.1 hypothetical protein [Flavihumibacter stibioxidans]